MGTKDNFPSTFLFWFSEYQWHFCEAVLFSYGEKKKEHSRVEISISQKGLLSSTTKIVYYNKRDTIFLRSVELYFSCLRYCPANLHDSRVTGQLLQQDLFYRIVPLHHLPASTLTLADAVSCLALAATGSPSEVVSTKTTIPSIFSHLRIWCLCSLRKHRTPP
jgi:hypothetical protein